MTTTIDLIRVLDFMGCVFGLICVLWASATFLPRRHFVVRCGVTFIAFGFLALTGHYLSQWITGGEDLSRQAVFAWHVSITWCLVAALVGTIWEYHLRNPKPAKNPYTAGSAEHFAYLKGVEEGMRLKDPMNDDRVFLCRDSFDTSRAPRAF